LETLDEAHYDGKKIIKDGKDITTYISRLKTVKQKDFKDLLDNIRSKIGYPRYSLSFIVTIDSFATYEIQVDTYKFLIM
jgi:hypothetical protein